MLGIPWNRCAVQGGAFWIEGLVGGLIGGGCPKVRDTSLEDAHVRQWILACVCESSRKTCVILNGLYNAGDFNSAREPFNFQIDTMKFCDRQYEQARLDLHGYMGYIDSSPSDGALQTESFRTKLGVRVGQRTAPPSPERTVDFFWYAHRVSQWSLHLAVRCAPLRVNAFSEDKLPERSAHVKKIFILHTLAQLFLLYMPLGQPTLL